MASLNFCIGLSICFANTFHMAFPNNSLRIHHHCVVAPPSATSTTQFSLPLTFFDLIWLRFHPVERIFFYSLPIPQSNPSFFYEKLVPKLKTSLSNTLQHFLPLAGNIVWPSESPKPIIQYKPGDGVSLVIAEFDAENFNQIINNSLREAEESRYLVPELDSSDSQASVVSLQITLFPNRGFSIGIATHHAVLDGKSSIMFIKSWASLCQTTEAESSCLVPELMPFFDREVIKDPSGFDILFIENWNAMSPVLDPTCNDNLRSVKILSNAFKPNVQHAVRATYELTRGDLEEIRKRVLSKWDTLVNDGGQSNSVPSKPPNLSTFVLTCAYVSVFIAKAIEEAEKNDEKHKFAFGFTVDCRARLKPPIPDNYFGNCVVSHFADTQPDDFTKEDGVAIIAKKIQSKIKLLNDESVLDGAETLLSKYGSLFSGGVKIMGVAGSTRFGVYGVDFGWGRPSKVEITSVDRGLSIGLAESKEGKGGVEVGLVLNKHVMDRFRNLFHSGLCQINSR